MNKFIEIAEARDYFNLNSLLLRKSNTYIGIDIVGRDKDLKNLFAQLKINNIPFELHSKYNNVMS